MSVAVSNEFYISLVIFLMQAKQQVIGVGADFGLSGMQTLTLLMLDDIKTTTMSGLCKRYNCDAGNITGIIDGLEAKGLVSRQADAKDRRVKIIRIEPAGKVLQTQIISDVAQHSEPLFGPLDDHEKTQFASLMQKLASGSSLL